MADSGSTLPARAKPGVAIAISETTGGGSARPRPFPSLRGEI